MPKNLESILQRQINFWEMRRRLPAEGGGVEAPGSDGPWITLSREVGSGGTELAQSLGRALDWQVFDHEILSAIAEHTHSRETVLSRLDERAILAFNDYIAQMIIPRDPGQVTFRQETVRVIWGLARQGSAIILGRGANWFLNPTSGLRLRVRASLDVRLKRIAADRHVSRVEAERIRRANDAEQEAFIRQTFGRDINDPFGYDAVLNLGSTDVPSATRMAVAALHKRLEAARR